MNEWKIARVIVKAWYQDPERHVPGRERTTPEPWVDVAWSLLVEAGAESGLE